MGKPGKRARACVLQSKPVEGTDLDAYQVAVTRLICQVRSMKEGGWSPTPERKSAELIADLLCELSARLEEYGPAQDSIEVAHDNAWASVPGAPTYAGISGSIRNLAATARKVADELPDPRKKHALPFAALALLHLRYRHRFPAPSLYDDGDDVRELTRVLGEAGIYLAPQTVRNALSDALKSFDPLHPPDSIAEVLR